MIAPSDHLKPWWSLPIACIDYETTSADPATCAPVEMAVVRFEGGRVVERYSALINPGCPIPAEATAIHGITDEMVADASDGRSAWSGACRLLLGAIPCAYNAPFDRTILHRLLPDALDGKAGCDYMELETAWPWLDPLVVVWHVDRYVKGTGRHKLTAVCERRGIKLDGAHRATADAEAAGRLLFSDDIRSALGDATISDVLRRQQLRAAEQNADFERWKARQS